MDWLLSLGLGYALGSIPFGLLLAKAAGKGDIRHVGSGNIGATNVLRTGSKGLAAAVLLLDAGKGFLAVWLARVVWEQEGALLYMAAAGFGALVGHCFPVWLRFKGGKGVATMLGVAFAFDWRIGAASALVWLAVALLTRLSSLGGMSAVVAAPLAAFALSLVQSRGLLGQFATVGYRAFALVLAAMALIVLWQHRANIARLRAGTEPKIGRKE